jgi:hypothetical protein
MFKFENYSNLKFQKNEENGKMEKEKETQKKKYMLIGRIGCDPWKTDLSNGSGKKGSRPVKAWASRPVNFALHHLLKNSHLCCRFLKGYRPPIFYFQQFENRTHNTYQRFPMFHVSVCALLPVMS